MLERSQNFVKRTEASEKQISKYLIELYKDISFQGSNKKEYQKVAEIEFDGMKDFVFCSSDVDEENYAT